MLKAISLLFLFASVGYAAEYTYEYYVYRASFPTTADEFGLNDIPDVLLKGYKKANQPIHITRSALMANTNYYHIVITPTDDNEKSLMTKLKDKGAVKLLRYHEITNTKNVMSGVYKTDVVTVEVNDPPKDYYENWSVKISS